MTDFRCCLWLWASVGVISRNNSDLTVAQLKSLFSTLIYV